MIAAGIDVGFRTTCALIMRYGGILFHGFIFIRTDIETIARRVMDQALPNVDISYADRIIATGYTSILVLFVHLHRIR